MKFAALILLSLLAVGICPNARARSSAPSRLLTLAAASDLQSVLPELERSFQALHPELTIKIAYGASGTITSQIENGAPFDLFLSADSDYPKELVGKGLARSAFEYAQGSLVLWLPNSSPLNLDTLGMKAVSDPSVRKIAIANPEHAPYGKAAVAALKSQGLFDQARKKLVIGENIAQASQYLVTHAADAGFIAQGLAESPSLASQGKFIAVPLDAYPAIHQSAVILKSARNKKMATAFKDFLMSAKAKEILSHFGYRTGK